MSFSQSQGGPFGTRFRFLGLALDSRVCGRTSSVPPGRVFVSHFPALISAGLLSDAPPGRKSLVLFTTLLHLRQPVLFFGLDSAGQLDGSSRLECETSKSAFFWQTAETLPSQGQIVALFAHEEVISHVPGSRNSLDGSDGVYRIHSDEPGAANVQQSLHHRSIPGRFNRISPCNHVHSAREAAPETCLHRAFRCTILSGLGYIPRRPRLTSVIGST